MSGYIDLMEPIIVIVGFLGAGKTTLLKKVTRDFLDAKWSPFVILNDYQNARLDAQQFLSLLAPSQINALHGSCICCSGITELRSQINLIPKRERGVTLIEANGTSDACKLMGFLGVGLTEHFLPPIQVSVIDAKHWQKRGYHNELEAHQIQVSSLVILNHTERVNDERLSQVKHDVIHLNPTAKVRVWSELKPDDLLYLNPSMNTPDEMDHIKAHWSSCSVDLPDPITSTRLHYILNRIPDRILRIKGCTKLDDHEYYSFFERLPSGEINIKRYYGDLVTGPKILTIGPGSDPDYLNDLIEASLSQQS